MEDVYRAQRDQSKLDAQEQAETGVLQRLMGLQAEGQGAPPSRAQRRAMARFTATRERKATQHWRRSQEEARRLQQRVALLTPEERTELGKELGLNG